MHNSVAVHYSRIWMIFRYFCCEETFKIRCVLSSLLSYFNRCFIRQGGQLIRDKSNFELPIRFLIKPSIWVIAVIYLTHFGALICTILSNIPIISMLAACSIIVLSLIAGHYSYIYRLKEVPAELLLNELDEWYITETGDELTPAVLLPEPFVHTHLVVLRFSQEKRNRRVILTPDNLSNNLFRRLSVRLRFPLTASEH
jgi:hypothetical protein